ncbi:MAG: GNAT family N-acetyltransferase [Bowdeniella nasicola]|nr:GNAT family N-acetyltransferase [Bowdeniella nasicola]
MSESEPTDLTISAVWEPSGAQIDLASPVSPAWEAAYGMSCASTIEFFGNADQVPASASAYRSSSARPTVSDTWETYCLALPAGVTDASDLAGRELRVVLDESLPFDAWDPTRLVAQVSLGCEMEANLTEMSVDIFVREPYRRAGIGRAALAFARERAEELGRTQLIGWSLVTPLEEGERPASGVRVGAGPQRIDGEAHPASFLLGEGASIDMLEYLSGLQGLTDAARRAELAAHAEGLKAEAAARAGDAYRLVSWVGPTPADLLAARADMATGFSADLDRAEGREPHVFSPERVAELEAACAARGVREYTTAAQVRATGELVAYTLVHWRESSGGCIQEDTWVAPAHRGHRLGLLVKAENLLRLLALDRPPERVVTFNSTTNTHMWAINERLGYERLRTEGTWRMVRRPDGTWGPRGHGA